MLNQNQIQIQSQIQSKNITLCLNFADFEEVKKLSSYFTTLSKSKNLVVILMTLNKSKKTNSKTPVGETRYLCIFFCCLTWLLFFFSFECIGIQFFNSLACDLRDAMPRQTSLTLICREAEDFPRGDNHSKHVALPTYLA